MLAQSRGDGRRGTAGEQVGTAGDCGGRPGTARVMSYKATINRSDSISFIYTK